jgi:hypothetical protein
MNQQAIEASYYLDNDTDWMLHRCYTRACNNRLFTTVAPQLDATGAIFWTGILSYNPAARYSNEIGDPRRYESVFTGVRPWCLTVLQDNDHRDRLYIHSHDEDGVNRLYAIDEDSDYDINHRGEVIEVKGFIETRAYYFENPYIMKSIDRRFYRIKKMNRTINIKFFSRAEVFGEWNEMSNKTHLTCRTKLDDNGVFVPTTSHPQSRAYVMLPSEKLGNCYPGKNVTLIQYRIEFTGPMSLEFVAMSATQQAYESTVSKDETICSIASYEQRKDYYYSICKEQPQQWPTT